MRQAWIEEQFDLARIYRQLAMSRTSLYQGRRAQADSLRRAHLVDPGPALAGPSHRPS